MTVNLLNIPGNTGAVLSWLKQFSPVKIQDQDTLELLEKGEVLVLPGGNASGLSALASEQINTAYRRGVKIFSICGSFQSMFSSSSEDITHRCFLNIFPSNVKFLGGKPRIGLYEVKSSYYSGKLYFNHFYGIVDQNFDRSFIGNEKYELAESDGLIVAVKTKRILAVQFHPELSRGKFDSVFEEWIKEE